MANYFPLIANISGNAGLFTELPVGGNINMANSGIVNLSVDNLHITGGTSGQMLKTDGGGTLTWATVDTFQIQNGNSNVVVRANSTVGISSEGNANVVTVDGNGLTTKDLTVTGTMSAANANLSFAVGNLHITGGSNSQYLQTNGSGNLQWATIDTDRISKGSSNILVDGSNANVNAVLNVNGSASFSSSVTIAGDLTVNGTTTTLNSTTVSTNDKNIVLANNAANAQVADGAGITINGAGATLVYDATTATMKFNKGVTANYFSGGGNALANIQGSNIVGKVANATYSDSAGTATTAGSATNATNAANASSLTSAGQANIIQLGTLTGLTMSPFAQVNLGNVANIHIGGGTSGQFLKTDGASGLSWANVGTVTSVTIGNGAGIKVTSASNNITSAGTITLENSGVLSLNVTANNGIILSGNTSVNSANGSVSLKARVANVVSSTLSSSQTSGITITEDANTGIFTVKTGNIAGVNLDGNPAHALHGDGTWATIPGLGTVTVVKGNGSGLGFTLSGNITEAGNIDLTVPSATTLRTNLGIGNVSNISLDGNLANALYGNGVFAPTVINITPGSGVGVSNVASTGIWTISANVANLANGTGIGMSRDTANGNVWTVNANVASLANGSGIGMTRDSANGNVWTVNANVANLTAGNGIVVTRDTANGNVWTVGHRLVSSNSVGITNESNGATTLYSKVGVFASGKNTTISQTGNAPSFTTVVNVDSMSSVRETVNTPIYDSAYSRWNCYYTDGGIFDLGTVTSDVSINVRYSGIDNLGSIFPTDAYVYSLTVKFNTDVSPAKFSSLYIDGILRTVYWAGNFPPATTMGSINIVALTIFHATNGTFSIVGSSMGYQ